MKYIIGTLILTMSAFSHAENASSQRLELPQITVQKKWHSVPNDWARQVFHGQSTRRA